MGSWIPEDDLLSKNTLDNGASLESLAKGAMRFSREFTFRKLEEQWRSLLYYPVVSEGASSQMIKFERSSATTSKSGRIGNSKEKKNSSGNRKSQSVRSCYYARQKRIRPVDLSFDIASDDGKYVGIQDNEHVLGNRMLGNPISDYFGVQETNTSIMHSLSAQILANGGASTCLDRCKTDGFQTTIPAEAARTLEENQFLAEGGSGIEESHQPRELSGHNLFEANDLLVNNSSTFDQMNYNSENVGSEFGGNLVFNSMDCGLPTTWTTDESMFAFAGIFDQMNNNSENVCSQFEGNMVFNTPIMESGLSNWRTDEGSFAADDGLRENNLHQDNYMYGNAAQGNPAAGLDVDGNYPMFESEMPCMEYGNQTANMEGNYLAEIANTLMNDEPFFMAIGAKTMMDNFDDLSSLWASSPSPNKGDQDQMPNVADEWLTLEIQDNLAAVSSSYIGEVAEVVAGSCNSDVLMLSSASTSANQFPELTNGIICCTLNTVDLEIPCNDDVVFPKQPCPSVVSSTRQSLEGGRNLLSTCVKDFSWGRKTIDEISDCRFRYEDSLANWSAEINARINAGEGTLLPQLPKEKSEEIMRGKPLSQSSVGSFIEKPAPSSDMHNSHRPVISSAIRQEVDAAKNVFPPKSVVDPPAAAPSDSEDLLSVESDGDIPSFSDVEEMILDTDLVPIDDHQDLGYDQNVAKYQNEDSIRTTIRLEQSFTSHMQRAIASHGAFTVLYDGRHPKHYINKPQTSIGRSSEDFVVDIDLGREGLCGNKL